MNDALSVTLTAVALIGAGWSLLLVVPNKPLKPVTTLTLGIVGVVVLLEIGLLVQAVVGVATMITTDRELDRLTFAGYLVALPLILPLAAVWALAERTRWSAGVLMAACLSVPVMIVRLQQIWIGHG